MQQLTRDVKHSFAVKVVIRGARKVGKSSLLARLQGRPFVEMYHATPEITSATLKTWKHRTSPGDVVWIDVWDVVDRVLADERAAGHVEDDDLPAGEVADSHYLRDCLNYRCVARFWVVGRTRFCDAGAARGKAGRGARRRVRRRARVRHSL